MMVSRAKALKRRSRDPAEAFRSVYQDDHCVLCGGGGVVHCTFTADLDRQSEIGGSADEPLVIAFGCCRRCMARPDWPAAVSLACFDEFGQGAA